MPEHRELAELVHCTNEKIIAKKDPNMPYVGLEHIPQRGSEITEHSHAGDSISTNSVFRESDVLFGKLRPNLRKCVLARFAGYCSTDILVLRALPGASPSYAVRVLQSEQVGAEAEKTAIGTKMPRTSWASLKNVKVFAPSISQQQKIAQILDTLDTQIQKTEALIAKLEKIKEGLLHDLLTRGIDQNGQLRPTLDQAPELYKESALGLIPREWGVARIEEVSTKVTNGFVGIATPHYSQDNSGVLYLYGNNIRPNYVDLKKCERVTQRFHSLQTKSQLQDGDMLTVQSGHIGACAVYEKSLGEANCHALIITRFKPEVVRSKFAALYCNSAIGMQAQGRLFIGSTILHINTSDLAKLAIPVPPVPEQSQIINAFISTSDRLSEETKKKNKLMKIKTGLMNDLLTGRVRVTPLLKDAV